MKPQNWLALYSLTLVYITLMISSVIVLINVPWGFQALITAIEAIMLFITFIILHILERRYDPTPCDDQEYIQIGMKRFGDDITMAGVPLSYGDAIKEKEEQHNVQLRKQALASIINSVQLYSKNGFFSDENLKN